MNKKRSQLFLLIFVFFIPFFGSSNALAAETSTTSTVVYNYVDINTLTVEQRSDIIKGNPNEINTYDNENYLFVYQKEEAKIGEDLSNNTTGNRVLLKTGDAGSDKVLVTLGLILLGGSTCLFIWKRKRGKQVLLIFILLGGSSLLRGSFAYAIEQNYLREQESIVSPKGTKETKEPESIFGYSYIGYIHTFRNNEVPKPEKKGTVVVNYQDENGDALVPSETLEGIIGKNFETSVKDIEGYNYKQVEGIPSGVFSETTQVVTYIYTKVPVAEGTVLIKYTDQDGNEIHEPQKITGNLGEAYDASMDNYQLQIKGYTLDISKLPNNIKGVFTEQTTEIIFVYSKEEQEATITIRFVDRDGNPFTLYNLMTYKNGSLVPRYPNLDQYHMQLDYNQQIYNQGEQVPDISLKSKIGEPYSLPERMKFTILDDKGAEVSQIGSVNEDGSYSGIRYWQNYNQIPDNREGIVDSENIVITYEILGYAFSTPPGDEE